MEGSAEPWTAADLAAARLIGATVSDVVLQFRLVQMLILQDQLAQVQRQVQISEQPMIVADAAGQIVLTNEALRGMFPARTSLDRLDDLAAYFSEPGEVRHRLADLVKYRQTWRGEIYLNTLGEDRQPVLIRADPVYADRDRLRGFVVLLTDNAEQKAAAAARRRFQEGLVESHRLVSGRIGSKTDLTYHNLMSTVVENAQLAALEITDRADIQQMPQMLESVRASVARTADVLEHLIWYARRRS
jgi:PAS domain-containing protein